MLHEIFDLLPRSIQSLEPNLLDMGQKLKLQGELVHNGGVRLFIESKSQLEEFALLFGTWFSAWRLRT